MFALDCRRINGRHLGTCMDRFYFGSCCAVTDASAAAVGVDTNHLLAITQPVTSPPPSSTSYPQVTEVDVNGIGDVAVTTTGRPTTVVSLAPSTERPSTTTVESSTAPDTSAVEVEVPEVVISSAEEEEEVTIGPEVEVDVTSPPLPEEEEVLVEMTTETGEIDGVTEPTLCSTEENSTQVAGGCFVETASVPVTEPAPETTTDPTMETDTEPTPETYQTTVVPAIVPTPEPVQTTVVPDVVPTPESVQTTVAPTPEPVQTTVIPTPEPIQTTVVPAVVPTPEPVQTTAVPTPEPVETTVVPAVVPTPEPVETTVVPAVVPTPEPVETTAVPDVVATVAPVTEPSSSWTVEPPSTPTSSSESSSTTSTPSTTIETVNLTLPEVPTVTTASSTEGTTTPTFTNDTSTEPNGETHQFQDYRKVCGRPTYEYPTARIVGGTTAHFGQWPWQVSLRQWKTATFLHKCGAALLNENWAITAAHCVENVQPDDLLLRLGEYDLASDEEEHPYVERKVQIVASHPQFDARTFEYDLALLRFYDPVRFQPNIIPICLAEEGSQFVGKSAFVTGWGRLYEGGPLPPKMQQVSVPIINNTECEGMYRRAGYVEHIPSIFICAGYQEGKQDSCEGDSGGPMVIRQEESWVLGGVISWGIGCAEANQPGVYTRISEFREWIDKIIVF